MGEFEELLGDMGVQQWVRTRFVEKLRQFHKSGSKDVDKLVSEFNVEILREFTTVARKAVEETIKRADTLMSASVAAEPPKPNLSQELNDE